MRKDYDRTASILTEDVISFIRICLKDDEISNIKKQKHTAKRIYDRLVAEMNFTGEESTVRRIVSRLREKTTEAFIPLSFLPIVVKKLP